MYKKEKVNFKKLLLCFLFINLYFIKRSKKLINKYNKTKILRSRFQSKRILKSIILYLLDKPKMKHYRNWELFFKE